MNKQKMVTKSNQLYENAFGTQMSLLVGKTLMGISFQEVKLTIQNLIFPKWYNAKYDVDDDVVYAYDVQHNYKIGDHRIKE